MSTKLDLTFKVKDQVRFVGSGTRCAAEIVSIQGGEATVRWKHGPRYDDWTQSEVPLGRLSFACHHHGAPFTTIVLDEDRAYKDGYHSGLAIGLTDQFYQAGGPGGIKMATGCNPCRHYQQHDEFDERNNKAWRKGWAAGQERARMRKPLDFTQPLRLVKDHRPVHYVGPLTPTGEQHIVNLSTTAGPPPAFDGSGTMRIDSYGSQGHGHYENVVENVPPRTCRYRAVTPNGAVSGMFFGSREETWETFPTAMHIIQIDMEGDEVIGVGVLKRKP